ncbi:glycosyltransferase family 1 protein [Leptolyngbya sp. FACHB-17]|uniref:glycosyltransferase family 4 protein n=1 Tax=unclassified Leptolyngbya TaxID=2650499 RepID=UPI001680AC82|nr:glycosyltransferase family 1 protein [Leptolyngbya sp. FACHB-17]MBD2081721.1 glycosyltransferase family 4 protein [Leptolyngbya sp. FACHB-17]
MRAALILDYPEEQWHSMDLCAQMLLNHWRSDRTWQLDRICPSFQHRLTRFPKFGSRKAAFNSDRLLNRFWDYPNYVRRITPQFDVFHVCDHTYAQLVHELPANRAGVYCHDIDAFRSLVEPEQEPRPRWYRVMSQRILDGLQKAAIVFYSTQFVRQQLEHYQLVNPAQLVHAPLGIAPEFSIDSGVPVSIKYPFILHIGSCIPRKRVDILLDVFGELSRSYPDLHLVKVGGDWTSEQRQQLYRLNIRSKIIHLHNLPTATIAALYRRAEVVLIPSEAEGFGLPLIEALACGAIVVASDLPVLREVAGDAALYCPVGEISIWVKTIQTVLNNPDKAPDRSLRLVQASRYSWQTHADTIMQAYLRLGA